MTWLKKMESQEKGSHISPEGRGTCGGKNKVLVYPPNDIGEFRQNKNKTSGNPSEYCDEE